MLDIDDMPSDPFATTLRILGNSWKFYIVQHLLQQQATFDDLHRLIPAINENLLSLNLRSLGADGIVTFDEDYDDELHALYRLTEDGTSLSPIIESMISWGSAYQKQVREAIG